jgi:tetrahydromethanopterin S-methyltransferase subunit G
MPNPNFNHYDQRLGTGTALNPFPQRIEQAPTEAQQLKDRLDELERKVSWMESLLAARIQLQSKDILTVLDAAVEIQMKREK